MFASRFGRFLAFALLAALIPACSTTKKKNPPVITKAVPLFDAAGVSRFPLLLLEFDRALDGSTVNSSNISINLTVPLTGAPAAPWGGTYSIVYLPGSNQVLIATSQVFDPSTEYTVLVYPQLESSEGIAIEAAASGGEALRFVVGSNANVNQPVFAVPAQVVGGLSGEIVWTWTQAQEAAVNISATYDFFGSLTTNSQDLFANPPTATSTSNTGFTMTGLTPGATYYFRVICRDSVGNIVVTSQFTGVANP